MPNPVRSASKRRSRLALQILSNFLVLVSALLFYYYVPISLDEPHPILEIITFVVGLVVLIVLIVRQLMKQLAAGPDPGVRVRSLLTLLYPVVVLFALTYYVIAHANPAQFEGIATRTDSLYYTVVTLGTVGYGDVHAVGQLAKWVTIIQVAFDLVVIGALIAVASSRFQIVPTQSQTSSPEGPPQ